jgi:ferritin-like metal-binding protein YciE
MAGMHDGVHLIPFAHSFLCKTRAIARGDSFSFCTPLSRERRGLEGPISAGWNKSNQTGGDMKLDSLKKLYVEELRDIYSAETQLVKALPKMAKGASSGELKQAFEDHLEQTKEHVERLEEIFSRLDEKPTGKTCKGMKGLIEEGTEMLEEKGEESVLDAGLIEHYEIAAYGTVRTFANLLGEEEAADLLQQTLDEEGETDKQLSELAEEIVNEEALAQDEEEEAVTAGSRRR